MKTGEREREVCTNYIIICRVHLLMSLLHTKSIKEAAVHKENSIHVHTKKQGVM
jgi:hypothetical protein